MAAKEKHDYDLLIERAHELLEKNDSIKSMNDLTDALGVNYNTFVSGLRRHYKIKSISEILKLRGVQRTVIDGGSGDKIEVEFDGNFGDVRVVNVSGQIRTVDELLKAAQVDRKEWEPFEPTVKKWDVALKLKSGDVEEVQVIPSFYVATRLRAVHPRAFEPVVQPVEFPEHKHVMKRKARLKRGEVRRALIVNDPQVGFRRRLHTSELRPFHDRRVLDIALQVAEDEQIDHISFGGDCLDLSEWSNKFLPEPEFFWTTQPAVIEWAWWLRQFRMAQPDAEMVQLEGNHDARMPNLIAANMRQAYRLKPVDELSLPPSLSVARLLALHQLGVRYVDGYPDNGYFLNKNVFIAHGDLVRSAPGATAAEIAKRQAFTTIFGHIHRRELVARRMTLSEGDLIYSAFCPGCACLIDGTVPGSTSKQQWQQGFAVVEYTDSAETIIPIAVQDGMAMYNGRVWQARDRVREIESVLFGGLAQVTE